MIVQIIQFRIELMDEPDNLPNEHTNVNGTGEGKSRISTRIYLNILLEINSVSTNNPFGSKITAFVRYLPTSSNPERIN